MIDKFIAILLPIAAFVAARCRSPWHFANESCLLSGGEGQVSQCMLALSPAFELIDVRPIFESTSKGRISAKLAQSKLQDIGWRAERPIG